MKHGSDACGCQASTSASAGVFDQSLSTLTRSFPRWRTQHNMSLAATSHTRRQHPWRRGTHTGQVDPRSRLGWGKVMATSQAVSKRPWLAFSCLVVMPPMCCLCAAWWPPNHSTTLDASRWTAFARLTSARCDAFFVMATFGSFAPAARALVCRRDPSSHGDLAGRRSSTTGHQPQIILQLTRCSPDLPLRSHHSLPPWSPTVERDDER